MTTSTASPTWNLDNALEGLSKRSIASDMFDVVPEKTAPQSAPNTSAPQALKPDASNVFSSLPEKPTANARVNESQATPSLGEIFVNVRGILQELDAVRKANDYGKPQQRGINKAHHAIAVNALMQKFGGDIENAYGIPSGDVPQLFTDVSKSNAGFRSKEDIDRIHNIVKNGVPDFVDTKGNTVALPKNMSFAQAIEVDNQMFTSSLKGKEPVDLVKRTRELQEVLKASSDANGEPLPGQEAVYDNAHTALGQINGIPTATSQYGFGVGRLSKQKSEFENAQAIGAASYGGVTSDQFGARISELQSQIQQKAIKHAPTFNTIDERAKWLSNRETASLPFFMSIGGKPALVRATEDPNVLEQFVEKGKSGSPEMVRVDLNKKPTPEKTEKTYGGGTDIGLKIGSKARAVTAKIAPSDAAGLAKLGVGGAVDAAAYTAEAIGSAVSGEPVELYRVPQNVKDLAGNLLQAGSSPASMVTKGIKALPPKVRKELQIQK